ncbi:MAG TPA: ATP-dependent DNA helicase [Ruminiclostridium sp.]|nr:ATP-dependent DNA helicase [Ruminiclostridium sp.]
MSEKSKEFITEENYLNTVLDFLKKEISDVRESLETRKHLLYHERRELGVLASENQSSGLSADISQSVAEDQRQLAAITMLSKLLDRDERLLSSPYFGRFDFKEDGEPEPEKFYIGLHNVYDANGDGDILVYDWRAPISSIYYRSETGRASYTSPNGEIGGELSLKRQYRIENSALKYFFDSSLVINDEVLQETLAHNASPKMQSIVRTIQSEQDLIIRDTKSDLLIAQGSAGSGKTTIALHRIAYLLYHSALQGLTSKNIIIISLSDVFSVYIGAILPQLGEENVREITFGDLAHSLTGKTAGYDRVEFIDNVLKQEGKDSGKLIQSELLFKGSRVFAEILERFLRYYERRLIKFTDISYGGKIIANRDELKGIFLNNKTKAPALSRLRRIETMIKSKIDLLQPELHKKLQNILRVVPGHQYDYKSVARLIAIKETTRVLRQVAGFTRFDSFDVYSALFKDKRRFYNICKGLELPEDIEQIFDHSASALKAGAGYQDMAALCYISLLIDKPEGFDGIKHVVVDEAQDYLPLHYAVLSKLFPLASYTVLGDIGQSVETGATPSLYKDIIEIFNKKNPILLTLKKSYRSSYEITNFSLKIPAERPEISSFERHEKEPELIFCKNDELDSRLAVDIKKALDDGFGTVAVICPTKAQARELYERLSKKIKINLLEKSGEVKRGALIMPAYLSKGLEFDCVFAPFVNDENYKGPLSLSLLYIICTRALHRLNLYYDKESRILKRLKG